MTERDSSTMENPQTPKEFAAWLKRKHEDARATYKSGPRSENPRQTDIALGRLRAYRDAYRVFLEASDEEVSELVE